MRVDSAALHLAPVLLGQVSALQLPLFQESNSKWPSTNAGEKPLINSPLLQEQVKAENLLDRARQLYKIAELGEDEYNHPTRVIGSKGTTHLFPYSRNDHKQLTIPCS